MTSKLEKQLNDLQQQIDIIKKQIIQAKKEKKKCINCNKKGLIPGDYWMSHRPYGYTDGYECQYCKYLFEKEEIK